jgi:hypothetical protein
MTAFVLQAFIQSNAPFCQSFRLAGYTPVEMEGVFVSHSLDTETEDQCQSGDQSDAETARTYALSANFDSVLEGVYAAHQATLPASFPLIGKAT